MKTLLKSFFLLQVSCLGLFADTLNEFTWTVQKSGYDEKGATTSSSFIAEFEAFPWDAERRAYNRIREGTSATLSVKDSLSNTSLWVSIAGEEGNSIFLVG